MALPGELLGTGTVECMNCGTKLPLEVCRSAAGYYLGHFCPMCGPYSRESLRYWNNKEDATKALESGDYKRRSSDYFGL